MDTELKAHVYEVVDGFCAERITEEKVKNWCASRGVPRADYAAFYNSKLGEYCLPPQVGGWDGPFIVRALLAARLARRAGGILPFQSDMNSMALLSTMRAGSQQEIVEDLTARNGRVVFSQAFSESDLKDNEVDLGAEVTTDGERLFLDGEKTYVANGQFIPETLVLTRDEVCGGVDGGFSLWLVPIITEGVSTYPINTMGQEMLALARIEFSHVELNPEWRIQTDGKLSQMLGRQKALTRILTCAASLGLAQAAMDDACAYCRELRAKGDAQNLLPQMEILLADMAVKIRMMESLVETAAESVSDGSSTDTQALNCDLMKYYVPKAATEVADAAMQIYGGVGYTDDSRVSRIWRDCRGNRFAQGVDDMVAGVIAARVLADPE